MNTRHLRASLSAALLVQLCSASGNGADEGWKLVQYRHGRIYVPKTSERLAFESVVMRPEERDKTGSTNAQSNGDGMVNSSVTLTLEMPTDGVYDAKSVETDTIQQSSPSQKAAKVSFAALHSDEAHEQTSSVSKWSQRYSESLAKKSTSRFCYSKKSVMTDALDAQQPNSKVLGHDQSTIISAFDWRNTLSLSSAPTLTNDTIRDAGINEGLELSKLSENPNVHVAPSSNALIFAKALTLPISASNNETTDTGLMATAGAETSTNHSSLHKYDFQVSSVEHLFERFSVSSKKSAVVVLNKADQKSLDVETLIHARMHDWKFVMHALSRGANPLISCAVYPFRGLHESALMHAALAGRFDVVVRMLDSYDAIQSGFVNPVIYRAVHAATLAGQTMTLRAILYRVSNSVIQARMLLMPEATFGMMLEDGFSTKINPEGILSCYKILINAAPTASLADALSDINAFGLDRSLAIRELLTREGWYSHISRKMLDATGIGRFIMRRDGYLSRDMFLATNALETLIALSSWRDSLLYTAAHSLRVDVVRLIYAASDARGDIRSETCDNFILSLAVNRGIVELAEYMVDDRGLMPNVDQILSWSRGFRNMELQSNAAFKAVFNRLSAGNQDSLRTQLPHYLLR